MRKKKFIEKNRFTVNVWFNPISLTILAKNSAEAKRMAYERLLRRSAYVLVDKKSTDVTHKLW